MITNREKRRIFWQAQHILQRRGLSRRDLRAELASIGIDLSYSQVCRLVSDNPGRLSLPFLEGLINVLQCTPAELFCEPRHLPNRQTTALPKQNMRSADFDFPFSIDTGDDCIDQNT